MVNSIQIKIDGDEFLKLVDEKLDEIADDIFANSQQNIVDKQIIDEGTLLKSGNINRRFLSKTIIYPTPYADSIEFGRLSGDQPPVEALKAWIARKGIENNPKKINSIAWAIATDIKENGMEPRPYLGPAIEQTKSRFR